LIRVRQTLDGKSPVDWEAVEPYDVPDSYELCRCGGCANKPFADEGGCSNFDGTEVAPTDTYAERAKTLGGTQVTIKDDRGICSHAGFCGNRITNVWKAAKILDEDEELRKIAVRMVELCPSGALTLEVDGEVVEPPLPVQIGVEIDGPYRVTGGIPVTRADGEPFETRHRVSLCRCGHSKNKPLCDGTHKEVDFKG
jgi:CDGSH-type Zn-finger protein